MSLKKPEDPIIYFALIDFLVQLIFFGLFIFVAYQLIEREKPTLTDKYPSLPIINALGPYVSADAARDLVAIMNKIYENGRGAETLKKLLNFLRLVNKPVETLNACFRQPEICQAVVVRCEKYPDSCRALGALPDDGFRNIGNDTGAGKPHCVVKKNRILFTLTSYQSSNGVTFQISDISSQAKDVLNPLGIEIANNMQLSPVEFSARFLPLIKKNCTHTMRYDDKVNSLDHYKTVNSYFFLLGS
jgi:hypothetical protein